MEHARHVFRVALLLIAGLAVVSIGRTLLVPASFGLYGPYRYDNVAEQMKVREPAHAGPAACGECHEKEFKRRAGGKHATVSCEVCHAPKAFHVKADLPGVKKEDISVEVEGDQVSVTAEVKRETEEKKDEKVVHSERYYGKQFRSFTLARPIDRKAAQARFVDGVLDLTLPKGGEAASQKLTIQ